MYVEDLVLMTHNEGNLDEVEEHTIVHSYCVQLRMGMILIVHVHMKLNDCVQTYW